jgi:hypothetical protein
VSCALPCDIAIAALSQRRQARHEDSPARARGALAH